MSISSAERTYCVGRFAFVAPAEMSVMGRSQTMYGTNINTVPDVSGGIESYWKERLAKIGPVLPRRFELLPETKSAWYRASSVYPDILMLELVKPVTGGLLDVSSDADAGQEPLAESLVADIVNSYIPSTDRGFCVGIGAITIGPAPDEQTRLTLTSTALPDIQIRFSTIVVSAPDTKTYSDMDEDRQIVSSAGGTLVVLRDGQRSAAGLSGKEIWISASVSGEAPALRFTWHYPGVAGSGAQPSINIIGIAPLEKRAQLETIWNVVLKSLKGIPLPPPEQR